MAPDGSKFATISTDRKVRVFRFATGKLSRTFDESLEAANELQRGDSGEKQQKNAARRLKTCCTLLALQVYFF